MWLSGVFPSPGESDVIRLYGRLWLVCPGARRCRRGIETEFSIRVLYVTALSGNSIAAASCAGGGGWRGRGRGREGREGREESFQLPVTSLTPDPPREHPGSRGTVPKRRARQRPDRHLDTCHQECECHGEERICRGCPPPSAATARLSRGEGFPAPTFRAYEDAYKGRTHAAPPSSASSACFAADRSRSVPAAASESWLRPRESAACRARACQALCCLSRRADEKRLG